MFQILGLHHYIVNKLYSFIFFLCHSACLSAFLGACLSSFYLSVCFVSVCVCLHVHLAISLLSIAHLPGSWCAVVVSFPVFYLFFDSLEFSLHVYLHPWLVNMMINNIMTYPYYQLFMYHLLVYFLVLERTSLSANSYTFHTIHIWLMRERHLLLKVCPSVTYRSKCFLWSFQSKRYTIQWICHTGCSGS